MRTSRTVKPWMSTRATPSTRCSRLPTIWSPRMDNSRALRLGTQAALVSAAGALAAGPVAGHRPTRAMLTTGSLLSLLKRAMVGCLASRGKPDCAAETRSRTSCMARFMSVSSENSTLIAPWPSPLREVMRLTPATLLMASSSGLMSSRSTASGEAPG